MENLELYQRMTNTYASGWSHLDDWQHLGTAKMLQPRMTAEGNGYDEGGQYLAKVIAPRHLKGQDLTRAIENTIEGSSCTHEHDCCGCPTTHARVTRTSSREYSVFYRVFFNY
jgi:hypothetical protein